ncbi:flavodoxin family protein [Thermohalobacter berrensis]|uniref:FMN reductase n=1 Tax=Thermohalobacter berrensis TaxID=99594 RepID=A0A419SV86_9FIRM|nr:NAD(P)H-dependent oxidoreductase [Thermohalobacter berrensis]RKD29142.1 FMN reductase [Thermohalobacter berrensis]
MKNTYLIMPENPSLLLYKMVKATTSNTNTILIKNVNNLPDLRNKKIVFAVQLNNAGFNIELSKIFTKLWNRGKDALSGSTGVVLTHSHNELFTKTSAQNIIFHANQLGCRFPGRPLVEATGSLCNLLTMQKVVNKPLENVCLKMCESLGKRLIKDNPKLLKNPKILVLHSSNHKTSNTLMLWDMVKKHLRGYQISEIHIENGTVRDCIGCPYTMCKHYSKQERCFYGGIMVEEVYPAVLEADAIIWICPNYNDAISANLTAVINRLTALFRKTKFYNKTLFGIIVSGNSGSDALAKQLISALNINKTFRLPPYFCIMATANDKGAILKVPNIEEKAKAFAENIKKEIKA